MDNGPFQIAATSRAQQEPHQHTKLNMPMSQALQHMLKYNLVTLKDPPRNPNTFAPSYHPNERCVYHSNSSGYDTDSCRTLKYKIQDLIDEGALEFAQYGQLEFFCHPSKAHHLK